MDKYYVSGVIADSDGNCEMCADEVAQFWTLYERDAQGMSDARVDCNDPLSAETVMAVYAEHDELQQKINDRLSKLLPDCRYMDPPDGGSVTPIEQVERMVAYLQQQVNILDCRLAASKSVKGSWKERAWDAEEKCQALQQQVNALAVENYELKKFCKNAAFDADYVSQLQMEQGGFTGALNEIKTPATDAYLNSVRAEGIHFAANRMLAAWESGFIDDTPAQALEISGAVLSALEFLPNASPDEFTRDYADEVRSAISAQLRNEGGA